MEQLRCVVCDQTASGQNFLVVSCRPCAAFYRRWLVNKQKYKCINGSNICNIKSKEKRIRCRACRLRLCQLAGFQEVPRLVDEDNSSSSSSDAIGSDAINAGDQQDGGRRAQQELLLLEIATPNLAKLVEAHSAFMCRRECSSSADNSNSTVAGLLLCDMFEHAVGPFALIPSMQDKIALAKSCVPQVDILNYYQCTLEQMHRQRWPQHLNDNKNEHFQQQKQNPMEMFMEKFTRSQHPVSKHDFCVLMALVLCNKAKQHFSSAYVGHAELALTNSPSAEELLWSHYRESLLSEWFHYLAASSLGHQKHAATLKMARLIATQPELEKLTKDNPHCQPCANAIGSATTTTFAKTQLRLDNVGPVKLYNECNQDAMKLYHWCQLLAAHKRISGAFHELDDAHLDRFKHFDELLAGPVCLLSMANQFSTNPRVFDQREREIFFAELNALGPARHPRVVKNVTVNRLLDVDILKAMPVYQHLSSQDRAILVRHQTLLIDIFLFSYYSVRSGWDTLAGSGGLSVLDGHRAIRQFAADEKFMALSEKTFTAPLEPFLRMELPNPEEIALLLAILCCYPAITDLSKRAGELLSREQDRYSALLLRHLQMQLGQERCVKRYAELLLLLGSVFHNIRRYEIFVTYLEVFYLHQEQNTAFPKCVSEVV